MTNGWLRTHLLLILLCLASSPSVHAEGDSGARLAADVFTAGVTGDAWSSNPLDRIPSETTFVELGEKIFFIASDGIHGHELWRSDGTAAGTALVVDLCPGACPGAIEGPVVAGDRLYFVGDDGAHGRELFASDGTAAGTILLADIFPGLRGSFLRGLTPIGNRLVFNAVQPGATSNLWVTDGTSTGTGLVAGGIIGDIVGGTNDFALVRNVRATNLYRTDGTPEGTALLNSDLNLELLVPPVPWQGGLAFVGHQDETCGIWRTDGTPKGTVVLDTFSGEACPRRLVATRSRLWAATRLQRLWTFDGITSDPDFCGLRKILTLEATAGGKVYFRQSDGAGLPPYLAASDGTCAGTFRLSDSNVLPLGEDANGQLVVLMFNLETGWEPWRSDGTPAGTQMIADLNPGPGSFLTFFDLLYQRPGQVGSSLYLPGRLPGGGLEPWRLDTTGGAPILDLNAQRSSLSSPNTVFGYGALRAAPIGNGSAVFTASEVGWDGSDFSGPEPRSTLWRTKGDPLESEKLLDARFSFVSVVAAPGDHAFFFEADLAGRVGETDGTVAGTAYRDISPQGNWNVLSAFPFADGIFALTGGESSSHELLKAPLSGGDLDLFAGATYVATTRDRIFLSAVPSLRVSDGTSIETIFDPPGLSSFGPLYGGDHRVYLRSFLEGTGYELWTSDGTEAGTFLLADVRPGFGSGLVDRDFETYHREDLAVVAVAEDRAFFVGDDGEHGPELWTSDGTSAGTRSLGDLFPGPRSAEPRWLTAVGARAFFVADDGVHGRELWVSDGSPAGTRVVADLWPGPKSSVPEYLTAVDGLLLFSAADGLGGRELWIS
ncbi:MAG: hypothetical protein SF066_18695, partial [Thermoanaerobaculia bacterium]|nr:hypothetical protein [Thermoanaerobaculia bacterium]